MDEEIVNGTRWSKAPVCSCTGGGKEVMLDGQLVIFRNPACRVHVITLTYASVPLSAETLVGNWSEREKVK